MATSGGKTMTENSEGTTKVLKQYTDDELLNEQERRTLQEAEEARQARSEMVSFVLKHKDVLLQFINHSRGSCGSRINSGYHPEHGGADCHRCCLDKLYQRDDIQITVEVQLSHVKEEAP